MTIISKSYILSSKDRDCMGSRLKMNMDTLAKQSLEAAMLITGTDGKDEHTQEIAFKLACMAASSDAAN